jgi:hypothetical protein
VKEEGTLEECRGRKRMPGEKKKSENSGEKSRGKLMKNSWRRIEDGQDRGNVWAVK